MQRLYKADPAVLAWWVTEIECTSAIARRQRLGQLREEVVVHGLRTADALQLAAAFFVAEPRPSTVEFVSLDERLLAAARREGFVTPPVG